MPNHIEVSVEEHTKETDVGQTIKEVVVSYSNRLFGFNGAQYDDAEL